MRLIPLALLGAALCGAHEIGTTRVSVLLQGGRTYEIEIATDATALAEKLESLSGGVLAAGAGAAKLQSLLTGFDEKFRQRVAVDFDGVTVRPAIGYTVEPAVDAVSAAKAGIRLTGAIPPGARALTWKFGWTFSTYSLTVRTAPEDKPATQWLEGSQPSAPIALTAPAADAGRLATAWRYVTLGFTHIVPHGLDHMLFVLGIYLLSRRWSSVLWQVSAFTVAHSITLGLSMYGMVSLPSKIVEPLIALSIAYVAIENIFVTKLHSWRVALVFAFGLLHGLGFAGVLQELGLPPSEFLTALLAFNVGVEAGQLAVIGAAFLAVGWRFADRDWYRGRVVVPASVLIACTAVYWTIERLMA